MQAFEAKAFIDSLSLTFANEKLKLQVQEFPPIPQCLN
jgi:hypothetical protein